MQIIKASKDTNGYRKRLTGVMEYFENKTLDFAITNGLEIAGMDKDMVEDLVFAKIKPIDKALEYLREFQQEAVNISIAKRDLAAGTVQLERQLKNASEKITKYELTLGQLMTFLGKKGMLNEELIECFNGSKSNKELTNAILELQNK
jgi:hypothetical protein